MQGLNTESLKKFKTNAKKKGFAQNIVSASELGLDLSSLSKAAVQVVSTLQKHKFKAYLVGGCIRDLLLGKKPKDFDVSTDATPEQVHRIFSNSRIIGRRFKIVHVVFSGQNIIEVTTFRSNSTAKKGKINPTRVSAESGMLLRDNVYGKSIVEDSQRRDFTINALYLDPVKKEIYDYNGGLYDMQNGIIDIIGDPDTRYSEDPVRMIRALRFSAKLGFKLSKRTSDPIKRLSALLLEVSNARMFEEVNKLFITGHGYNSFKIIRKYNIFELLFPDAGDFLDNKSYIDFVEYALSSSDKRYAENKRNMPHFLYSVILWGVFQNNVFRLRRYSESMVSPMEDNDIVRLALDSVFDNQDKVTDIPMAVSDSIKSLWRMQLVLQQIELLKDYDEVSNRTIFRAAFDFISLRTKFEPYLATCVNFWQPYYVKSAAIAAKRKALKDQKYQQKFSNKKKSKKQKGAKNPATEDFEDETNLSAKRKEQLAKARAWRASMNLGN